MAPKKAAKGKSHDANNTQSKKTWSSGGQEDELLLNSLKEGKISKETTVQEIHDIFPELAAFSKDVIRTHWSTIKKMHFGNVIRFQKMYPRNNLFVYNFS